ncbi:MAG: mandelate racemase/muconate lactonizing enzyme family protein [Paracoccaceae bacterium]
MPDLARIQTFLFERPRDIAYLGGLDDGDLRIGDGYVRRAFNGTVYPLRDRSIVVRIEGADGAVGWGETYGLVAPAAVAALIADLYGPFLLACDDPAADPAATWDAMYGLQRVRGYWGGYGADAMAALDIALWDLRGRREGLGIGALLGGADAGDLPAYASGLPAPDRAARGEMAARFRDAGFDALKIPVSATEGGDLDAELAHLRGLLGEAHRIAVDLHWTRDAQGALEVARTLARHGAWFMEAPVAPEDLDAQRRVARTAPLPIALGEEWRTTWDYAPRRAACAIVQPEMGHTGVTQFARIALAARADGKRLMPHATIGLGLFAAASLRAGLALGAQCHEFQHSVYPRNADLLEGAAPCEAGAFRIPTAPGLGVTPNADGLAHLTPI